MNKKVVLLGAMPQEVEAYNNKIKNRHWNSNEVYVEITGVGKPAAAATTERVITHYKPDFIIFSGVAGSLDGNLKVGDIGIGIAAIDADIDVRLWDKSYKRGEIPFSRKRIYFSDRDLVQLALSASSSEKRFEAYIASGSKFLDKDEKKEFRDNILKDLEAEIDGSIKVPNIYEMEGSAVLQVAEFHRVPCLALRAVSDDLHGDCPGDFNGFIEKAVENYVGIVNYIINNLEGK